MALHKAVRHAIEHAPCTLRALARQAGVSHALLVNIKAGKNVATVDVARKLIAALTRWGNECVKEASRIRAALEASTGRTK